MNIAVVCPDDLSIVLFCKGIIEALGMREEAKIIVISDIYSEDHHYTGILKTWGVTHIPLPFFRYFDPFKDLKYLFALYRLFRKYQVEIVVNISTKPNIYGAFAAKAAGVKKVLCSVWGRGSVFVERDVPSSNALRCFLIRLYKVAFRLSTTIWFTNRNDFEFFIKHRIVKEERTIITKNYVNTEDYQPYMLSSERIAALYKEFRFSETNKVVIMVARMIWSKGIREFVEATESLRTKLPSVKFILVGPEEKDWPDAVPISYLREHEQNGNFLWVGFRKDVKDLYAMAELAVLPSYYKEGGYPRALTEPMAMGKPVIAADTVDCKGPVEHGRNGYLVPVKNSAALADAIETLMKDDEKLEKFGSYSRIKAKRDFDEKTIVKQVIDQFLGAV